MKKPILPLIILCIVALPFIGTAQTMYSLVDENTKLKKGDWFNIEFANRLEDYSTPVDSIDYCTPFDLKQLVLHCEVTEATEDNINMSFKFERIFHLKENGQYGDSYFEIDGILDYEKTIDFDFLVDIDLQSNKTEITKPKDRSFMRYTTLYRNVNIEDKSSSTSYPGNGIEYQDIEALISKFLADWKATDFKLPLPTFGKVVVDDFECYRILDANIAVIQNTTLLISTNELNSEEEIKVIFIKDKSNEPFQRDDILLLTGETQNGQVEFQYYLEEQKQLTLVYREKEIDFVATPEKNLEIKLSIENDQIIPEFSGDNIGDNEYKFQFLVTTTRDRVLNNNMFKIESLDELFNVFNDEINQRLDELNSHKHNMSVVWYKKQLKEIYYWAAGHICNWHQIKNQIMDFSKLKDFVAFSNINPLYDYYLNLRYYESYIDYFENYKFDMPFTLVEINQWFSRGYSFRQRYDIIDAYLWGYPKYYLLKEILVEGFENNGIDYVEEKYDRFIADCRYPSFITEVKKAYEISMR